MIHPMAVVMDALKMAGVPDYEIHDTAGLIRQAHEEANEGDRASEPVDPFPGWAHLRHRHMEPVE